MEIIRLLLFWKLEREFRKDVSWVTFYRISFNFFHYSKFIVNQFDRYFLYKHRTFLLILQHLF